MKLSQQFLVVSLFFFGFFGALEVDAAVPDAPINLTATGRNERVELSWDAPANNGGQEITDYTVWYKKSSDPDFQVYPEGVRNLTTAVITTGSATSPSNGTSYDFRVYAVNADGTGATYAEATATPNAGPPLPFTAVSARAMNGTAYVSYRSPENTEGSNITSMQITVSPDPGGTFSKVYPTAGPSVKTMFARGLATISGLDPNTEYTFTLTATNSSGTSDPVVSNAVTPSYTGDGVVRTCTVVATGGATVNWESPATWSGCNGGIPDADDIASYVINGAVTLNVNSDAQVGEVRFGGGLNNTRFNTLTIKSGYSLTVYGELRWDKYGELLQEAGSSVTAENYALGNNVNPANGYTGAKWTINGTAENRASVNGNGNITTTNNNPSFTPDTQIDWEYADITIRGMIDVLRKKNSLISNSFIADHCYFHNTGYALVGFLTDATSVISVTNSDFRYSGTNAMTKKPQADTQEGDNYGVTLIFKRASAVTTGSDTYEGNVFAYNNEGAIYDNPLQIYFQSHTHTEANPYRIGKNVFKNMTAVSDNLGTINQKSVPIYENLFFLTENLAGGSNSLRLEDGGQYVYGNVFMARSPNTHVLSSAGAGTTALVAENNKNIIEGNVFDVHDGDADIIFPKSGGTTKQNNLEIRENLFIGNGTALNVGISGLGGIGSEDTNSPFATVTFERNTTHLGFSAHQGLTLWNGETSYHKGTVLIRNNIMGHRSENHPTYDYGYGLYATNRGGTGHYDGVDYTDYNWFYPDSDADFFDPYYDIVITGKTEGIDEGFGLYDQTGDPQFNNLGFSGKGYRMTDVDDYLNGGSQGDGTEDGFLAEFMKRNQNVSGETFVSNYTAQYAVAEAFSAYTPQNSQLDGSGYGGADIGAVDIEAAPDAPTALAVTGFGDGSVAFEWIEPATTATTYDMQYRPVGSVDWSVVSDIPVTRQLIGGVPYAYATVTGLTNGTAYEFAIRAGNASGYSEYTGSPYPSETPLGPPEAPQSLVASGYGDGYVDLSWNAPANDGGESITHYVVQYREQGPTPFTDFDTNVSPTSLSKRVDTLANGTIYEFAVYAVNARGDGAIATVSETPHTVPDAPQNPTATAGNAQATVSFTAPANDGGATITNYTVTSSPSNLTASGSASPLTITGLTNGTAYTFTVVATNSAGDSSPSVASNEVTPATVPDAPTITSLTYGDGTLTVSFDAPANDGGATILDYTATATPGNLTATASSSPITITGLTNGTAYTVTITARNSEGSSDASASDSETPRTTPDSPTSLSATAQNTAVDLSWDAPANDGGATITDYIIEYKESAEPTVWTVYSDGTSTDTTVTVPSLTNGTDYDFRVSAVNSEGSSTPSSTTSATPQAPSATTYTFFGPTSGNVNSASTDFTVTPDDVFTGTITITPSGAGATGLSPIVLTFSNSDTPQAFTITPTVAGSITLTPANNGGLSDHSALSYTANATVPDAPQSPTATAGNAQATVSFTAPANDGGATITNYTVTSSPGNLTASGSASPLTITGLTNGTAYTFTLVATNSAGDSSPSSATSAVVPTNPNPTSAIISNVSVEQITSNSVVVMWVTDQSASTKLLYGIDPLFGESTEETNTTSRVTSHSVALTNLKACVAYTFKPVSKTANNLTTTGSLYRFTTAGCTVSTPVVEQESAEAPIAQASTVTLENSAKNTEVVLDIPQNYASQEAIFQVKQLAKETFTAGVAIPENTVLVGYHLYNFQAIALSDSTNISAFTVPLSVQMRYTENDILGLREDTLTIKRYDGLQWNALSNCRVFENENRVMCETQGFSDFGLFGEAYDREENPSSSKNIKKGGSISAPKGTYLSEYFREKTFSDKSNIEKKDQCTDISSFKKVKLLRPTNKGFGIINLPFRLRMSQEEINSIKGIRVRYREKDSEQWEENYISWNKRTRKVLFGPLNNNTPYVISLRLENECSNGKWSNPTFVRIPRISEKFISFFEKLYTVK